MSIFFRWVRAFPMPMWAGFFTLVPCFIFYWLEFVPTKMVIVHIPIMLANIMAFSDEEGDDKLVILFALGQISANFIWGFHPIAIFFAAGTIVARFVIGCNKRRNAIIEASSELRALREAQGDTVVLYAHGLHSVAASAAVYMDRGDSNSMCIVDGITSDGRLDVSAVTDLNDSVFYVRRAPLIGRHVLSIPCSQWPRADIGGEADASEFAAAATIVLRESEKPVVLFGSSRGSATVFNALTIMHRESDWETVLKPRIRFVVLAGIYATVHDAIEHSLYWPFTTFFAWLYSRSWLGFAWRRDESWSPFFRVADLPGGVPIGIIAAKNDQRVPFSSTERLIDIIESINKTRKPDDTIDLKKPLVLSQCGHAFPFASVDEVKQMMRYMTELYENH